MPTPAQTSTIAIVAAGREILEREGPDGLSMKQVAEAVGVRPPSLYKRVRDRADLLRLIVDDVANELTDVMDAAAGSGDPHSDLRALASAFRTFAHARPAAYALLFDPRVGGASRAALERSSASVLRTAAALAGEAHALPAARTVVAWAHGFISMELAGAFQLGGHVDEAWDFGLERVVAALAGGR